MKAVLTINYHHYLVTKAQALEVLKALAGAPELRPIYPQREKVITIKEGDSSNHFRVTQTLASPSMMIVDDRQLHVVDAEVDDPKVDDSAPTVPERRARLNPARQPRLLEHRRGNA